jgi:ATP-binding cassette subfamily C (CFTR/MRP) protein 1
MLGHMKSIKMSGLSRRLLETISNLRLEEMNAATPFRIVMAVNSAVSQIPQMISPVAAFAFFTIKSLRSDETFDVTRVFVSLSLTILLSAPLFTMSHFVLELNAAIGCFSRIEQFLSTESHTDYRVIEEGPESPLNRGRTGSEAQLGIQVDALELRALEAGACTHISIPEPKSTAIAIDVRDASFSWSVEGDPVVKGINLALRKGQMAMIIGPVASGKTTLLKGFLGEVPVATGQVKIQGRKISWCDQSSWLKVGRLPSCHDISLFRLTRRRMNPSEETSLDTLNMSRNFTNV